MSHRWWWIWSVVVDCWLDQVYFLSSLQFFLPGEHPLHLIQGILIIVGWLRKCILQKLLNWPSLKTYAQNNNPLWPHLFTTTLWYCALRFSEVALHVISPISFMFMVVQGTCCFFTRETVNFSLWQVWSIYLTTVSIFSTANIWLIDTNDV